MKLFTPINGLEDIPHFSVEKQSLFKESGIRVPNLWSLTRTDTDKHIGVCSDKYRPIQIDEMIETIIAACEDIETDIQHIGFAGSRSGSQLVIQSKIGDLGVESDPLEGYFYTLIDHRGKAANKIIPSMLRIACTNAFHLVKKGLFGYQPPSLRHNDNFEDRVEDFRYNLRFNIEFAKNFKASVEELRSQTFSKNSMMSLIEGILPMDPNKPSASLLKKREEIFYKFGGGIANEGKNKWDALNAVTEFETHQKYTPNKFIRSLTFNSLSTKAAQYLLAA